MDPSLCPVLAAMSDRDRARIADRLVRRRLAKGDHLHWAGDRASRVHLLLTGVLKLAARSHEGHETILLLATPGEVVDDMALLDEITHPLDAVAASRCEVAGLEAELMRAALLRNSEAALVLALQTARRMKQLCDTTLERTSSEVPARLAGRLLELASSLGRERPDAIEVDLPLAQEDLGRLAGMCRESACKTLRHFKRAGLLDYRGRRLRILRPDALERIRCTGRAAHFATRSRKQS
jgi:CRP/FNR family transcriptional regulator